MSSIENLKSKKLLLHGDAVIWIVFFFLCAVSLVEVYSATSTLTYKSGKWWGPIMSHSLYLFIGFCVVWAIHSVPCRFFKIYTLLLPISFALLIVVMLWGQSINGANRVLMIPGIGITVQPSELAKGALVTFVAVILSVMQTPKGTGRQAFPWIMWPTLITCALIFPENLSTAVMLFGVIVAMMFIGRVPTAQMLKLIGAIVAIGSLFVFILYVTPESTMEKIPVLNKRLSTWKHRVFSQAKGEDKVKVITPEQYEITDHNAQRTYSNIAIANSNIVGKMPGNSQMRDFLPQAYSDFIFSIIIEELGIWGSAVVALLYVILFVRAGKIAGRCEYNFPAFLVMGLSILLVAQALFNMCVAVGLAPVTGQPLPLISRGGSSMLVNCVYVGMMLSVSRFATQRKDEPLLEDKEFQSTEGME